MPAPRIRPAPAVVSTHSGSVTGSSWSAVDAPAPRRSRSARPARRSDAAQERGRGRRRVLRLQDDEQPARGAPMTAHDGTRPPCQVAVREQPLHQPSLADTPVRLGGRFVERSGHADHAHDSPVAVRPWMSTTGSPRSPAIRTAMRPTPPAGADPGPPGLPHGRAEVGHQPRRAAPGEGGARCANHRGGHDAPKPHRRA
jgi:hypothetical protein